ncbi:RNA polymerase sigma factor SigZ [Sedimenticola sp.]|uniref:RNA polymerase sigma factor SigZ n=1 Tax=Sedimenticola sp. TaxID=1940285 RepID=UPI003D0A0068
MNCILEAWVQHEQALRHYLRSQVSDVALAEDLLQDTFLKALAEGSRFCRLENSRAWLFHVAKNRLIDWRRTHRINQEIAADIPAYSPDEKPAVDDLSQCLPRVLKELPAADSEAITLCDIDGLTQAEYARRSGLTLAAAKSRIQRARRRLKQHLKIACQVRYDESGKVCCFTPRPPLP